MKIQNNVVNLNNVNWVENKDNTIQLIFNAENKMIIFETEEEAKEVFQQIHQLMDKL